MRILPPLAPVGPSSTPQRHPHVSARGVIAGQELDFCGRTHAKLAQTRGLMPPSAAGLNPTWVNRVFQGRANEPPYTLSELTNQHPKYEDIKTQFAAGWQHPTPCPSVLRVFQVRNPMEVFRRYEALSASFDDKYQGALPYKIEERRFHGTSLAAGCRFGVDVTSPPCSDPSCAVCSIAARSFDLGQAGNGPGGQRMALRYGQGNYFSRSSSKANDYAEASERVDASGRCVRVMFLCRVLLGKVLMTAEDTLSEATIDEEIAARGQGGLHDSVLGLTTAQGGQLNYSENVVYHPDQALPSYLIVYRF